MKSITQNAYAKLNLALDVPGLRADGYHEVLMLMEQIELNDKITITRTGGQNRRVSITCTRPEIPTGSGNLAYKAAMLMLEMSESLEDVEIHIEKHIPMEAGLAGGSADCAATLVAMNELFEMKLPQEELLRLGASLGSDVPFCITGGTAVARGRGTELLPVTGFSAGEYYIVLCKPDAGVSTGEIYRAYDSELDRIRQLPQPDVLYLVGGIAMGSPVRHLKKKMINVLEYVTAERIPEIRDIEQLMEDRGAAHAMMTGSGPTVFGLFEEKECAVAAFRELADKYSQTYITQFR